MLCKNQQCPTRRIDGTCTSTRYMRRRYSFAEGNPNNSFAPMNCPNYLPYITAEPTFEEVFYPSYSSNPANVSGNQHVVNEKIKEIEMLRNTIKQLNKTINLKNEEILTLKDKVDNSHDRLDV